MHVLYFIFNEGYASSSGPDLHRAELSDEAIRLTRMVHRLLPGDAEVAGLRALMLLIDARRPARTGTDGEIVALPEQDRRLWNRALVEEGNPVVTLNRAVAAAMVHGPQAGLAMLAEVGDRLGGSGHRLDAVRAHLLEMAGETEAAAGHYAGAAERATNLQERHYLARRAALLRRTQKGFDFSASPQTDG